MAWWLAPPPAATAACCPAAAISASAEKGEALLSGLTDEIEGDGADAVEAQVWSLTQFYSVDFSLSRIGVKKCVNNNQGLRQLLLTASLYLCSSGNNARGVLRALGGRCVS